jgi:serine/threonine-protein kinase
MPVPEGEIVSGKFRIERLLGMGGMGCVVAAHHLLLDERVALKFLHANVADSAEIVERFGREARAVAKLRSEHVTRVLDVGALPDGTPFIVMEYLDGKDLGAVLGTGQTFGFAESVDLIMQALEALAEAHRLGIVHRDLKPANLFISNRYDGTTAIKVLDFGISKVAGAKVDVTATALSLGTPSHMPPEQWDSARDADPRSDIWSIGTILFQLICGREPFTGANVLQLWHAITTGPTPSMRTVRPDVPAELDAIVARCLEKAPAARYQDVAALAVELAPFGSRRSGAMLESIVGESAYRALTSMASAASMSTEKAPSTGAASMQLSVADTQLLMAATGMRRVLSRPAVAVMPFENLSGDPEQAYFADGISEDIITSLSNWRWFPVIGRNSTFSLRGKAVGPAEVGRQVGARYVVDGSVRKAGNRVRVSAQLTDASSGHHLWTERYDREIQDIFALQDEISYAIVAAIEPQVAQAEEARIARTPIESYDAWDLSVQALSHIRRGTRNDLVLARSILERAILIDGTSSYSRSLLALAYFREALFGWTSDPARELASTRDAAAAAVALDGNDWMAHALYAIGLVWVEPECAAGLPLPRLCPAILWARGRIHRRAQGGTSVGSALPVAIIGDCRYRARSSADG